MGRLRERMAKSVSKDEWTKEAAEMRLPRVEVNRIVMDYLVTEGFKEAAQKFAEETGLEWGAESEASGLDERLRARAAVQSGDIDEAIKLLNAFDPSILDSQRKLNFCLMQQKLIELIRSGNLEEAVDFAARELANLGEENPEFLNDFERTMALMAFENPEESPFGDLLRETQRQKVANQLNGAMLESQGMKPSKLGNIMKLLFWSQAELTAASRGAKKTVGKFPIMTDVARATFSDDSSMDT